MKTMKAPATGNAKKKARPVTVTIEGELAAIIREGAKQMGFRASNWARQCIVAGDLASSGADEAKEYRLAMALSELRKNDRGTASPDGTVIVTPRYSVQEWVELALEIDEEAMNEMVGLKPFYREQLETDIYWFGKRLTNWKMEAGRLADYTECLSANESPPMGLTPFRMIMPVESWEYAKDAAAALGVGMAAYLRTGIWEHINRATACRGAKIRKTA